MTIANLPHITCLLVGLMVDIASVMGFNEQPANITGGPSPYRTGWTWIFRQKESQDLFFNQSKLSCHCSLKSIRGS